MSEQMIPGLHDAPRDSIERAAEILGMGLVENPAGNERNVVSGLYAIASALERIAACMEDAQLGADGGESA